MTIASASPGPNPSPGPRPGVVIVGAGVAGLAAAAALRRRRVPVTLIEASDRIGGRAHTSVPGLLAAPFDHGAAWLHAAERNPLAALATQLGDAVIDTASTRVERTRLPGRFAAATEQADYAAAAAAFRACMQAALAGPDVSLAAAAAPLAALRWLPAVLNWEAPTIAAADASELSLRDWHANLLGGSNWELPGGLGAFVRRRLGPPAGPVRLNTVATRIRWDGGGVAVDTNAGTIRGAACIVTVSTGLLASGRLQFDPALPHAVQAAIDGLPMGVLNKIALRAAGAERLDLPNSCGVDQFLPGIDVPAMTLIAWPHGQDHAIGFIGGSHAALLEQDGGLEAFARAQMAQMFGSRTHAAFRPGAVTTAWARNPWTLGAYAYARPGSADARRVLGTPLAGGRLVFAGEATRTDGLAGTVGGAFLAGEEAANLGVRAYAGG